MSSAELTIHQQAAAIARSGLFGLKDETQVLALMAVAQAQGRHPASVAQEYSIIQGRPALKADAMLSRFQSAGGSVRWVQLTDQVAEAVFSHPQGGSLQLAWTYEQATRAGLTSKGGPWKTYPRAMLRARLISEGIRSVFPGVVQGSYTEEEVRDMPVANAAPVAVFSVPAIPAEASQPETVPLVEQVRAALNRLGREAGEKILAEFEAAAVADLKPDDLPKVLAMAQAQEEIDV